MERQAELLAQEVQDLNPGFRGSQRFDRKRFLIGSASFIALASFGVLVGGTIAGVLIGIPPENILFYHATTETESALVTGMSIGTALGIMSGFLFLARDKHRRSS